MSDPAGQVRPLTVRNKIVVLRQNGGRHGKARDHSTPVNMSSLNITDRKANKRHVPRISRMHVKIKLSY